jgi:carboxypeptidase family protein
MIVNKKLSSNRNMYQVILNLLIVFDALWSVIPSVASIVTSFRNKTGEIDDTAEAQQSSLKTYKVNKKKKKREMADKALTMRGKLSSFAATAGNTILLGKMKIAFSKLFYSKDTTATGFAEIIYDAAFALTPAQKTAAGISDDEVTGLRDSIDGYKALPSPIEMRAIRKALTAKLPVLFKEGNLILTDSLDGLMYQFKLSNPDFYNQYFNGRATFESHRHTTIEGAVVDEETGEDLSDVSVLITSSADTLEEMTDVQGLYKRQISPDIDYKIKFILPDYQEQEFEKINLDKGEHQRLNVKLKKK